jgi:hypothetical protein
MKIVVSGTKVVLYVRPGARFEIGVGFINSGALFSQAEPGKIGHRVILHRVIAAQLVMAASRGSGTCPESRSVTAIRSGGELIHRCREIREGRSESKVSLRVMNWFAIDTG